MSVSVLGLGVPGADEGLLPCLLCLPLHSPDTRQSSNQKLGCMLQEWAGIVGRSPESSGGRSAASESLSQPCTSLARA